MCVSMARRSIFVYLHASDPTVSKEPEDQESVYKDSDNQESVSKQSNVSGRSSLLMR